MTRPLAALALVVLLATATPAAADNDALEPFYGAYVGSGVATRAGSDELEQRDLDVTIEPIKRDGFRIRWITVVRSADGDRTDPSVKRRAVEEEFLPSDTIENVYVLAPEGGLFSKAELPNPLLGEPMRWAALDGDVLSIYSLAISGEGGAELQIFHRTLTEEGMDVDFRRMRDEDTLLRVTGRLIRVE